MLDEQEWDSISPLLSRSLEEIIEYRRIHNVPLEVAMKQKYGVSALDFYFDLTGFKETNVSALYHHRISLYGPPCAACGKPLRSPRASFCAACGADAPNKSN
jgi:hypothetical protein